MERDFMGLSAKNTSVVVKEEIVDEFNDSASAGESAMQWSFSSKVSATPPLLSFKAAQEDRSGKTGYDSLAGLMTISSGETFDSNHRSSSGMGQRKMSFEKQVGMTHQAVTTYPPQQLNAHHPVHSSIAMNSIPMHQSFLVSAGQNVIGSPLCLQSAATTPAVTVVPTSASFVGTTELRNAPKTTSGPAQLTIFYGGSVCVYNDVSPEKAQAIMLLAGNGTLRTPSTPVTPVQVQVQVPIPKPSGGDGFHQSQPNNKVLSPGLASPISVTSHTTPQATAAVSCSTNDNKTGPKPVTPLASPCTKPEPPKVVGHMGSLPVTMIPSGVPQFRKASLARFLEKRKERTMSASPYLKQASDCNAPGSVSINSMGSRPLPAIN